MREASGDGNRVTSPLSRHIRRLPYRDSGAMSTRGRHRGRRSCRRTRGSLLVVFVSLIWGPAHSASGSGYGQSETTVIGGKTLTPQRFGAKGDGESDDWWAFQEAIDAAGADPDGGTIIVTEPPTGPYWRISEALRIRSKVTLRVLNNSTRIKCTGDADKNGRTDPTGATSELLRHWPSDSCVMFGSYEENNYMQLRPDPIESLWAGADAVVLSRPDSARKYAAEDIVVVETVTDFDVGREHLKPTWLQINRIVSTDLGTGRLKLRYRMEASPNRAQIRRLTNTGLEMSAAEGGNTKIPMWASFGASVIGGTWEATRPRAPFMGGGGALDCRLEPYAVTAYTGVGYGNLLARCHLSAHREGIRWIPLELALGSHQNAVALPQIVVSNQSPEIPTAKWLFGFDEGARDNVVTVGSVDVSAPAIDDVIVIDRASDNRVQVNSITGGSIRGSVVDIRSWNYEGFPPPTTNNVVEVKFSKLLSQHTYVIISGSGTTHNTVANGRYYGFTTKRGPPFQAISVGPGNTLPGLL